MSAIASLLERWRGLMWAARGGVRAANTPRIQGPRCIVRVDRGGELRIGRNLVVDRDVEIVVYAGAVLELGDNVYVGHGTTIACAHSIRIGSETLVGDLVSIRDMNHRREPGVPLRSSGSSVAPVRIGTNCWLGSKVTITAGTELGDEVTVAANAAVSGRFDARSTIGGVPAKVIASAERRE